MDIGALATSVTAALVPLLPYLFKAGEKAAEETGKAVAGQSWNGPSHSGLNFSRK